MLCAASDDDRPHPPELYESLPWCDSWCGCATTSYVTCFCWLNSFFSPMMVANRNASLLSNSALPTSRASALNASTLSMPSFIIMAAIMGPMFLFLPRPVNIRTRRVLQPTVRRRTGVRKKLFSDQYPPPPTHALNPLKSNHNRPVDPQEKCSI